ncbi:replication protein A 70 kDa DNA-binding subunit A [Daucus carota subsp. sativus]|uniref:replication protein A 70 kDa DNA-binding subunit A n=1 Tax=Daucus carota subsp. sativus TaxID=79200 RepID=UPI003082C97F
MDILLLDSSNKDMIVTLWEEKANGFQNDLAAADDGAAFVIITGLLVKKYSGKDIVLSSGDATRTYFNIDYAPLKELSQSMIRNARERGTTIPPPRKKIFVSTAENALKVVKIQDILEVELPNAGEIMRFICEANIINVSKYDGWYYNSCPKCPKGIRIEDNKFYCDACKKETDGYTQRYKIIIGVQDDSGRTTFALLNNDAEQLIGVPVRSIISDLGQDNLTQDIPPIINNIIGRRCAFEAKVSSYNRDGRAGYTVGRLIEMPGSSTHVKGGEHHNEAGPSKKARLSSPK